MKKAIVTLLIVSLFGSVLIAQNAAPRSEKDFSADFDAYIQKILERIKDIPGLSIVVIKEDKPIFTKAYGMADKEAGSKATTDTLYYIASSTKSFTALAAALLDNEGKIRLADPVNKYTQGISLKEPLPDKITVRDLFTHTSGLRNSPLGFRMAYSGDSDPKDMKTVFAGATTFNEAGFGKYAYTNLGYNIYAVLLDNHLKVKWQDLLQKKVFDPLKLNHTTAYISRTGVKKWTVAAPYQFSSETQKSARSPLAKTDNNLQSAGGMYASAADMGRWLSVNMNGGRLDGKQVFPANVIQAVHTGYTQTTRDGFPFVGDGEYGLGWQIGKYKNEKVIYHHGGFPGYNSHVSFMPDKKVAVAVMVNDGSVGGRTGHMLAAYAYDWWLQSPTLEADYAKLLQELVDSYEQGKQRQNAFFADRAKRVWQLSRPTADYVGLYKNEFFGTIEVSLRGTELAVRMGNLNCVATAFTEKESIRVEMIPGMGETIRFQKNGEEKIESLSYAGSTFIKAVR